MPLRLYDTMRRAKVDFAPADPKRVTMYVCGPTVYGRAHIGNARPAVVFDVLARLLRHTFGVDSVRYARNITDIDDKIIAAAASEGVDPKVITDRFTDFYHADMGALGVARPDVEPRATDHVAPRVHGDGRVTGMIPMIAALIDGGQAYAADGHVLFDVAADPGYGALSKRPMDAMIAGARVEVAPYKRGPADFVLWKPSTPDQPGWDSPWGRGRPGWHIECSAMIAAELAPGPSGGSPTIDIHGGGLDLIFPHHENELAQSSCAHDGAPLAQVWLHNGFLSIGGGDKMSKSLGNMVGVHDLLAAGWSGEVIRLALLSAHYRQPLVWSEELLDQSLSVISKWRRCLAQFRQLGSKRRSPLEFRLIIGDDLNTPAAIQYVHWLVDRVNSSVRASLLAYQTGSWIAGELSRRDTILDATKLRNVLMLLGFDADSWTHKSAVRIDDDWIRNLIGERRIARSEKDYAKADQIRRRLADFQIILEDGPGGTTWRRA